MDRTAIRNLLFFAIEQDLLFFIDVTNQTLGDRLRLRVSAEPESLADLVWKLGPTSLTVNFTADLPEGVEITGIEASIDNEHIAELSVRSKYPYLIFIIL